MHISCRIMLFVNAQARRANKFRTLKPAHVARPDRNRDLYAFEMSVRFSSPTTWPSFSSPMCSLVPFLSVALDRCRASYVPCLSLYTPHAPVVISLRPRSSAPAAGPLSCPCSLQICRALAGHGKLLLLLPRAPPRAIDS